MSAPSPVLVSVLVPANPPTLKSASAWRVVAPATVTAVVPNGVAEVVVIVPPEILDDENVLLPVNVREPAPFLTKGAEIAPVPPIE